MIPFERNVSISLKSAKQKERKKSSAIHTFISKQVKV